MSSGWLLCSVALLCAYLLGTFPSAVLVAGRAGRDPTAEGSQNPGASNVYRLVGRRAGAAVLAVDLGKGALATGLGLWLGDHSLALATGAAAVLGHVAPVTRGFRGGKGVATAGGMVLVLWPVVGLALLVVFVAAVAVVRIASVGSLLMAAGLPVGVLLAGGDAMEVAVAAGVAALVVARHHENIGRLMRGEERRVVPTGTDRPADPTT